MKLNMVVQVGLALFENRDNKRLSVKSITNTQANGIEPVQ